MVGFPPLNQNKQKCKMFPNNNHVYHGAEKASLLECDKPPCDRTAPICKLLGNANAIETFTDCRYLTLRLPCTWETCSGSPRGKAKGKPLCRSLNHQFRGIAGIHWDTRPLWGNDEARPADRLPPIPFKRNLVQVLLLGSWEGSAFFRPG